MATLNGILLLWFLPEFLSSVQLIQMQMDYYFQLISGLKLSIPLATRNYW